MVKVTKLKKAEIIGMVYYDVFRKPNGELQMVACSQKDYEDLAKKNAKQPKHPIGVWEYSYANYRYNTLSGDLEDDMYADNGDMYAVKLKNAPQKEVPKEKIKNDVLDLTEIL